MKGLISSIVALAYTAAIAILMYMSAGNALNSEVHQASVVTTSSATVQPS